MPLQGSTVLVSVCGSAIGGRKAQTAESAGERPRRAQSRTSRRREALRGGRDVYILLLGASALEAFSGIIQGLLAPSHGHVTACVCPMPHRSIKSKVCC